METSQLRPFGVWHNPMNGDMTAGWWFSHQTVVWQDTDSGLFVLYGKEPDRTPTSLGMHVREGVFTTQERFLLVQLMLEFARDDTTCNLPLDEERPEHTNMVLLAQELDEKERAAGKQSVQHMLLQTITTLEHADVRLLADPHEADAATDAWIGWGMPHGQLLVGPVKDVYAELEVLRRTAWDNLTSYQQYTIVSALLYEGYDYPREIRVAALRAFYRTMLHDDSDYSLGNAMHNAKGWAERTFGLIDDPMAMPWI